MWYVLLCFWLFYGLVEVYKRLKVKMKCNLYFGIVWGSGGKFYKVIVILLCYFFV